MTPGDPESGGPSPEAVDEALRAFWRGSSDAVDALATEDDESPRVGAAFAHLYETPAPEAPIEMVTGEYAVVREIGRGGMGVVYEARQESTGRAVALKVMLHRSASDPMHVKLFRREVQTLARLKHPAIATLYDAGQTASGQDYFAMELVSGRPLREYCRAEAGSEERTSALRLFQKVCEGISYAHQHGVIHRDLKPSNILEEDGGQPKILDFGLARLHDPDGELVSNITESGRILGTLAYMSPEQARGEAEAIDTRSDVYTLGLILYELLTGARPYEVKTSAWAEAVRKINEAPISRPSELNAGLRGDLESIIQKALAKEPAERYQSAAAFGEDIERYLSGLPVQARPPSGLYQLKKLILRHKAAAALAAALFLAVMVFAVVLGIQKRQIGVERDAAQAQARRAERISASITGMLQSVDPRAVGANVSVQDVFDRAAANLERELADDPATLAAMHEALARGYLALEQYERGGRHARAALELRKGLTGEHDVAYAGTLHLVGVLANRHADPEEAEKLLRAAYDLRIELLGRKDPAIAESLEALADNQFVRNQYPEADRLFREAIALWRGAGGHELQLAAAIDRYSVMLTAAGRYEEAEPLLIEALTIRRRFLGQDHYDAARTLTDLGEIYSQWGQFEKAEALHREQVRVLQKLYPNGHAALAHALSDLAALLADRSAYGEAETRFREAVEMEERVAGINRSQLTKNNYATFLRAQGRFKEAEPLCRFVYKKWNAESDTPDRATGYARQNLAAVLLELGRIDEAKRLYEDAEKCWRTLFGDRHPKMTNALIGLGRVAEQRVDRSAAERYYREAFDIRRDRLGPTHPETAAAQVYLAGVANSAESIGLCEAALGSLRQRGGSDHADVAWALGRRGMIERDQGNAAAAEGHLREAIGIERKLERTRHPNLAACLVELGEILLERGEAKAAMPLFQEAMEIQRERLTEGDARIARTQRGLERCRSESN